MKEVVVFAYNFPHKKTQDFLFRLFASEVRVSHVFAADAVKLDIPPSEVRTKIRHCTPLYPADVAKAMALGADAVSIGSAAMIALGDNDPKWEKDYNKLLQYSYAHN